jgi:aldose 1-epimerase
MVMTGQQYDITSGEHWAVVSEVGANLRGFRTADVDVTHVHSPDAIPPKSSGAVLMPWPNRIRGGKYTFAGEDRQLILSDPALGNATHGLANWARWMVDEHAADEVRLHCDVVPQKGWPCEVRAEISYRVDAAAGLIVTLAATNTGTEDVPFGAGSHPYLSAGATPIDDVALRVPARTRLVTDAAQIPVRTEDVAGTEYDLRELSRVGARRFDTAFTDLAADPDDATHGRVELHAGDRVTRLWWDHPTFTTVQVFTVDELAPGRAAVAVEPMTCPADAFNSGTGLIVLAPGDSWRGQWGIGSTAPRTATLG